jgi:hypothetical protein
MASPGGAAGEQALRPPEQDHDHDRINHERAELGHIIFAGDVGDAEQIEARNGPVMLMRRSSPRSESRSYLSGRLIEAENLPSAPPRPASPEPKAKVAARPRRH